MANLFAVRSSLVGLQHCNVLEDYSPTIWGWSTNETIFEIGFNLGLQGGVGQPGKELEAAWAQRKISYLVGHIGIQSS